MAGLTTKEIKTRIRSMKSTRQITKAMEMVAASKLRRMQEKAVATQPYFQILFDTVCEIAQNNEEWDSPYLGKPKGDKVLCVVIAGDRGLAGGYHGKLFQTVLSQLHGQKTTILPMGKKAEEFFQQKTLLFRTEGVVRPEGVGDCFALANLLSQRYLNGEFHRICIAYTKFLSALTQTPAVIQILPLVGGELGAGRKTNRQALYEPDSTEVFAKIVPEYVGGVLYGALCQSRAAEQAARRTAMESASKNAEELMDRLSLQFNRARQAAITQEITEIIAGSQ